MAITKRVEIGRMEILPRGQIQVRTDTVIEEDGTELSRKYHRHVVEPNHDVSDEDQRVKDVAAVVHTQECKDAWIAYLDSFK